MPQPIKDPVMLSELILGLRAILYANGDMPIAMHFSYEQDREGNFRPSIPTASGAKVYDQKYLQERGWWKEHKFQKALIFEGNLEHGWF